MLRGHTLRPSISLHYSQGQCGSAPDPAAAIQSPGSPAPSASAQSSAGYDNARKTQASHFGCRQMSQRWITHGRLNQPN